MATRAEWTERVETWEQSGMEAAEFALREGLNPTEFEWWCRELRASRPPLTEPPHGPAHLAKSSGLTLAAASPAPAAAPAPPAPAWIDIVLPDGGLVRLLPGVDGATLACVLAVAAEMGSGRRT
jgi:hypothetical protein